MNKAILLDRDGVINYERGAYTFKIEDFRLNDGIIESLLRFQECGYILIIISNQGGIAKGLYTKGHVDKLHQFLIEKLTAENIHITAFLYCPHHPKYEKCICRKPDSLLFEKAIAKYKIDVNKSYMFGDKERDIIPATITGIKGILIKPNENILPYTRQITAY